MRSALHIGMALMAAGMAAGTAAAPAEPIGRLFFSREERAELDARRNGPPPANKPANDTPPDRPPAEAAPAAAPPDIAPVQLSGTIRRSHGKSTVWLNDLPVDLPPSAIGNDGAVVLKTTAGRAVILKPGQSFDSGNGTVVNPR